MLLVHISIYLIHITLHVDLYDVFLVLALLHMWHVLCKIAPWSSVSVLCVLQLTCLVMDGCDLCILAIIFHRKEVPATGQARGTFYNQLSAQSMSWILFKNKKVQSADEYLQISRNGHDNFASFKFYIDVCLLYNENRSHASWFGCDLTSN